MSNKKESGVVKQLARCFAMSTAIVLLMTGSLILISASIVIIGQWISQLI